MTPDPDPEAPRGEYARDDKPDRSGAALPSKQVPAEGGLQALREAVGALHLQALRLRRSAGRLEDATGRLQWAVGPSEGAPRPEVVVTPDGQLARLIRLGPSAPPPRPPLR